MRTINETYLKQVTEKAIKTLENEYEYAQIIKHLEPFDIINTYLVYQANEKKVNLLIKLPHENIKEHFYALTILSTALLSFYKNYVYYEPKFKIGDIVEKDGVPYKITKITDDRYELYSIIKGVKGARSGSAKKYRNKKEIQTYVHTTGDIRNRNTKPLETYIEFFQSTFNIKDVVVSKFKYKFVIVTSKEIIESLKNFEIDSKKFYEAIPFEYITKTGTVENNLPIDPMIYIVNDYETAQNKVFDQIEGEIDTVIFIGSSKYRETAEVALNDRGKGLFQNCIFIGSEDMSGSQSICKWNWTQEEMDYFNQILQTEIQPIVVNFPELSEKVKEFYEMIRNFENKYTINISQYIRYARDALKLILPDRSNSRLNNQLENLTFRFEHDETLPDSLFGLGIDSVDEWELLKIAFSKIIDLIKDNNPKYQKLKQPTNYGFFVVPKHARKVWEDELKALGFSQTIAITFNEFSGLNKNNKVLFLDFFDDDRIKSILESNQIVSILLYNEEKEYLDSLLSKYQRELQSEYRSKDKQDLSKIKYVEEDKEEKVSELIQRLYEKSISADLIVRATDTDYVVKYEIKFEDGETVEIDSSRSVLLKDGDNSVSTKVEYLITGDAIRIYDNLNKDKLYEIAKQEDQERVFEQIEKDSLVWKMALRQHCLNSNESVKRLHDKLRANGLKKTASTLRKWFDLKDKDKFPAENRDLYIIKKTVEDEILTHVTQLT